MPSQSPRDYSKIKKVARLTQGNEGKSYTPSRGGINPKTGEYVKKGTLTQKPKGKFLEGMKTPRGDMKSVKTGKIIDGSKATGPKEMLRDSRIKTTSTKGRIPVTRQVRPSTHSPVTGKKMKKGGYGGSGTNTRGGSRGSGMRGGGGGAFLPGRTGFGEQ